MYIVYAKKKEQAYYKQITKLFMKYRGFKHIVVYYIIL